MLSLFHSLVCGFIILLMTEITSKVLTFFALIGIGFILKRTNLVDDLFTRGVTRFVLYVTLPALIVDSMSFEYSNEMFSYSVILLIAAALIIRFYGFLRSFRQRRSRLPTIQEVSFSMLFSSETLPIWVILSSN